MKSTGVQAMVLATAAVVRYGGAAAGNDGLNRDSSLVYPVSLTEWNVVTRQASQAVAARMGTMGTMNGVVDGIASAVAGSSPLATGATTSRGCRRRPTDRGRRRPAPSPGCGAEPGADQGVCSRAPTAARYSGGRSRV
jgi:hypothetical protein